MIGHSAARLSQALFVSRQIFRSAIRVATISPTNHEREVGVRKQRAFLLSAIFAAAAAMPAWGQPLVPAAGSATSGAQGAPSIPDFSGIWGNPFLTGGLEAPTSGPGLREALGKAAAGASARSLEVRLPIRTADSRPGPVYGPSG